MPNGKSGASMSGGRTRLSCMTKKMATMPLAFHMGQLERDWVHDNPKIFS